MTPGGIAVIGDMQRTLEIERRILGRPQLDWVRTRIQTSLLLQPPAVLILNGDLNALGSSKSHWSLWDHWAAPLLRSGIKILPVMGNHDYLWRKCLAIRNFQRRFPEFELPLWYSCRQGKCALVILDSNHRVLSAEAWRSQTVWFECELARYEADPSVYWIQVFSHHSPHKFKSLGVHRRLFSLSPKARSWVSGHEHLQYRHREFEKEWLVWGGGGGPPHGGGNSKFGYFLGQEQGDRWSWKEVGVK